MTDTLSPTLLRTLQFIVSELVPNVKASGHDEIQHLLQALDGAYVPAGPSGAPTRTPARLPCVGDCGSDGQVSVSDIIAGVTIAIGTAPLEACPASDTDEDGQVTINDLIVAVSRALSGCAPR